MACAGRQMNKCLKSLPDKPAKRGNVQRYYFSARTVLSFTLWPTVDWIMLQSILFHQTIGLKETRIPIELTLHQCYTPLQCRRIQTNTQHTWVYNVLLNCSCSLLYHHNEIDFNQRLLLLYRSLQHCQIVTDCFLLTEISFDCAARPTYNTVYI